MKINKLFTTYLYEGYFSSNLIRNYYNLGFIKAHVPKILPFTRVLFDVFTVTLNPPFTIIYDGNVI